MQGEFLAVYALGIQLLQHLIGKVQSSRGSCHRAFDFGVDRLVGSLVALYGLAVQVRRNGQFADGL